MANQVISIVLLSIILCSMLSTTDGKTIKTTSADTSERSSCNKICWGIFENCLRIDDTLTGHLLCLEDRDRCTKDC